MKYSFKDIVIDSRTGLNPRKNFVLGSGNNAYITIKDIYGGKINISEKTDRVDDEAIQIIKKRSRISVGDVLFVSIGRIGETAIVYEKDDSWDVNESIFIFTINKNLIIPEYFCLLFESEDVRNSLLKNSSGSTFKSIKMGQLEKMEFDIPSLQEQRTIVDRIHKNKAIIALRKAELQKLDELVKARFVEMFGDPVTNEKGWKTKPLLELGSCKNGMNFHYDDCGIEINCLGVRDFKDHSVITNTEDLPTVSLNEMPSEEYLLKDDDIVFVRSNGNKALVGRSVAVYPADTPTTFSGFCIRFRKTDDTVLVPSSSRFESGFDKSKMAGRGANIQI